MDFVFILLIALALDSAFGEPPNARHPVAWLGKLICWEMKMAPKNSNGKQLTYGVGVCLITVAVTILPVYFLFAYLKNINLVIYILLAGLLLKSTFSLRGLRQAVNTVGELLARDELVKARICLTSLVSRNTATLNHSQVISATVESAAENICDSFVAPVLYFLLFGLPGAVAFRVVNTFDAMIGYHGEFEYLGKFAARLDDVANFLPARITALLLVLASSICKKNTSHAWHIMVRDHRKTESPNAGWPMSAIAGALEVQLEKAGHHKLGDNHSPLSLDTIDSSQKMIFVAAIIWSLLCILTGVIYFATT